MQSSKGLLLVAAVLVLAGAAESAARLLPPLFRDNEVWENPNARFLPQGRVDDLDYRLPNSTLPSHYDIVLTTRVDEGIKDFSGTVTIDLDVVEETTSIVIHARQLSNFVAKIESEAGVSEAVTVVSEETREFLTITRNNNALFPKESKWKLTVEYTGELRTDNGGFYLSTYTDADNKVR